MKKKIVVLLLLILAGMWIFMSQEGWCRAKYPGHFPWEEILYAAGAGDEPNNDNFNMNTENSAFINISIFGTENVLKRGEKNLNNLKQEEINSGQVNK